MNWLTLPNAILGAIGVAIVSAIVSFIKKSVNNSKILIKNITEINDGLKYQNRLNSIQAENIAMLVRVGPTWCPSPV